MLNIEKVYHRRLSHLRETTRQEVATGVLLPLYLEQVFAAATLQCRLRFVIVLAVNPLVRTEARSWLYALL